MKTIVIFLLVFMLGAQTSYCQKTSARERKAEKAAEIKDLVESGSFTFVALSATPMAGARIDLTSRYDLILKGDSVEAWLPYYGRAYQAPYDDRDGGIKFQERAENMKNEFKERKESYMIEFEVKNLRDTYKMYLDVGLNGYANLSVNMNHRQSISFYGIIESLPEKENP